MNFKEALIAHLQGQKVEVKTFKHWEPLTHWASRCGASLLVAIADSDFATACQFRITPRTIVVNGMQVPAPETEAPKDDQTYFISDPTYEEGFSEMYWRNDRIDKSYLSLGIVYLDKESAIARAKAMLITQEVK